MDCPQKRMAVVERLKQGSTYGLSAIKNGHCREVAVSKSLTVAIINDHFFLSFHIPLLWFPAAMGTITWVPKE